MERTGLYIHIPFCMQKCRYCGFYSLSGVDEDIKTEYVNALCNEIKAASEFCKGNGNVSEADTVFIGGGTPSCIEPELILKIMDAVRSGFELTNDAEISMESNPGTLTREKLKIYKEAGINRVSMGVQSFDDSILKRYGRIHNAEDVFSSYHELRESGFENINLDLMFGLPGQSMENWQNSVNTAIKLNPEHISFYSLQLEEGTPLFEDFKKGLFDQIDDKTDRLEYHEAIDMLKSAGYEHYEISNAAKRKNGKVFKCRHNLKYWSFVPYIGMGAGASSFIAMAGMSGLSDMFGMSKISSMPEIPGAKDKKRIRYSNPEDVKGYIDFWKDKKDYLSDSHIGMLDEYHENTLSDNAGEYVFTALRKNEGLKFSDFKVKVGIDFKDYYRSLLETILEYEKEGFLVMDSDGLRLTESGFDISNTIMAEFV